MTREKIIDIMRKHWHQDGYYTASFDSDDCADELLALIEHEKKEQTEEEIDNLFVDFDEMGFSPTTLCEDAEKYAIEWRNNMRNAIAKHETDTLREFVEWLKHKQHISVENYKKLFEQTKNYLYCGKRDEAEYTLETLDSNLEKFLEERKK